MWVRDWEAEEMISRKQASKDRTKRVALELREAIPRTELLGMPVTDNHAVAQ